MGMKKVRGRDGFLLPFFALFCLGFFTCLICLNLSYSLGGAVDDKNYELFMPPLPCVSYFEEVSHRDLKRISMLPPTPAKVSKTLFVITPTFYRAEQKAELTRVAQSLLPVASFVHWVVVDDVMQGSETSLNDLRNFLDMFPLTLTLLRSQPPRESRIIGEPRGVGGRRAALAWIRAHSHRGILIFADDDNTYNSRIFEEIIGSTEKVSMWPVGLVTELGVSSPIVQNGKVIGFYDGWNGQRKFPVDMAGFAVNLDLVHQKPRANIPWIAGYEEDEFLKGLEITLNDITPLANNCTQILVWHTKSIRSNWPQRSRQFRPNVFLSTNLEQLMKTLPQRSLAGPAARQRSRISLFTLLFGD